MSLIRFSERFTYRFCYKLEVFFEGSEQVVELARFLPIDANVGESTRRCKRCHFHAFFYAFFYTFFFLVNLSFSGNYSGLFRFDGEIFKDRINAASRIIRLSD